MKPLAGPGRGLWQSLHPLCQLLEPVQSDRRFNGSVARLARFRGRRRPPRRRKAPTIATLPIATLEALLEQRFRRNAAAEALGEISALVECWSAWRGLCERDVSRVRRLAGRGLRAPRDSPERGRAQYGCDSLKGPLKGAVASPKTEDRCHPGVTPRQFWHGSHKIFILISMVWRGRIKAQRSLTYSEFLLFMGGHAGTKLHIFQIFPSFHRTREDIGFRSRCHPGAPQSCWQAASREARR